MRSEMYRQKKKEQKNLIKHRIIKSLFLVIMLISLGVLLFNRFGASIFSPNVEVEQLVTMPQIEDDGKYVQSEEERNYLKNKFEELTKINSEVIGYMHVPGDGSDSLNEPILKASDNEKYLNYDIYGKPAPLLGAVFADYENSSSFDKPDVKWIFGHARGGIEEKRITLDTRVFNNVNWFGKQDYFDNHRVIVIETPERKFYYEVTGVTVVKEDTDLYKIPSSTKDKEQFIREFKDGSKLWLESSKISGKDNLAVFATCRLENDSIRTLVLGRQIPDNELKEFLEVNKDLLES